MKNTDLNQHRMSWPSATTWGHTAWLWSPASSFLYWMRVFTRGKREEHTQRIYTCYTSWMHISLGVHTSPVCVNTGLTTSWMQEHRRFIVIKTFIVCWSSWQHYSLSRAGVFILHYLLYRFKKNLKDSYYSLSLTFWLLVHIVVEKLLALSRNPPFVTQQVT